MQVEREHNCRDHAAIIAHNPGSNMRLGTGSRRRPADPRRQPSESHERKSAPTTRTCSRRCARLVRSRITNADYTSGLRTEEVLTMATKAAPARSASRVASAASRPAKGRHRVPRPRPHNSPVQRPDQPARPQRERAASTAHDRRRLVLDHGAFPGIDVASCGAPSRPHPPSSRTRRPSCASWRWRSRPWSAVLSSHDRAGRRLLAPH